MGKTPAAKKGKILSRIKNVLALYGVVSLVIMYGLITGWNPLPSWGNWLRSTTIRTLSEPHTTWAVRAGDQPSAATVLNQEIIVISGGSVEAHAPSNGARMWSYDDSWAAVAGDSIPVVVVGSPEHPGFDVYDAFSGVRLWGSNEKVGVWAYSNMILTLSCPQEFSCTLRAFRPNDGNATWSLPITGAGRALIGLGRPFAALGPVSTAYADSLDAIPHPAPPFVGLPMSGEIHVVSTVDGKALHIYRPDASTRVALTRTVVIVTTATLRGNSCYYTTEGHDPATDKVLWSNEGDNLKTSAGLGCDQRQDPAGGGNAVLAIDTTGHDMLLSAGTGQMLFRAATGERVVATDGQIAMVRTADKRSLRAINLSSGAQMWTYKAGQAALVGVAPAAVLVADPGAGRLAVLDPHSGQLLLGAATGATVLGIGSNTIIINIGRTLGPLPLGPAP